MEEKTRTELNEILEQLLLPDLLQVLAFAKAFSNNNKELKRKNDLP